MKYLICVDNSVDSERAFEESLHFITPQDEIFLLTVREEISIFPMGDVFTLDMKLIEDVNKEVKLKGIELLTKFGNRLNQLDIPHTRLLGKGVPKEVICQEAAKLNVDVVIMGRKGRNVITRTLMGSNSDYCANQLHCNLLILHKKLDNNKAE